MVEAEVGAPTKCGKLHLSLDAGLAQHDFNQLIMSSHA
jgi:hypothetical protein